MTGLSGSGKTHAVKVLEDLGYYTLDNVPPALIPEALAVCERGGYERTAFVIDVRSGPLFREAVEVLDRLDAEGRRPHLLFFDASDEVLLRRYSETRHRHPLEGEGTEGVAPSIVEERRQLVPIRARADKVIDTTYLSVTDLRQTLHSLYGTEETGMLVRVLSFGYKFGLPAEADLVLDVRFMENPFYIAELRPLPGTDTKVRDFVLRNPATTEFLEQAMRLLSFALPRYEAEKKARLTVALGCTGGRHRSVTIAEELARRLRGIWPGEVTVGHRDMDRTEERT
jgi:UPF0042 nucleotide-binding protein